MPGGMPGGRAACWRAVYKRSAAAWHAAPKNVTLHILGFIFHILGFILHIHSKCHTLKGIYIYIYIYICIRHFAEIIIHCKIEVRSPILPQIHMQHKLYLVKLQLPYISELNIIICGNNMGMRNWSNWHGLFYNQSFCCKVYHQYSPVTAIIYSALICAV